MRKHYLWLTATALALVFLLTLSFEMRHTTELERAELLALKAKRQKLVAAVRRQPPASVSPAAVRSSDAKAAPPKPAAKPPEMWEAMTGDPKMMALGMRAIRANIDSNFQGLFRKLHLSAQQIDNFETLLVNQQMAVMDIAASASAQGLDPRTDPNIAAMFNEKVKELHAGEVTILGDEGTKQMDDYFRTGEVRGYALRIAQDTVNSGTPMTGDQLDQLATVAANASASYQKGGQANINTVDAEAVYSQAQNFLPPAQLAALKTRLDLQKYNAIERAYLQQMGIQK